MYNDYVIKLSSVDNSIRADVESKVSPPCGVIKLKGASSKKEFMKLMESVGALIYGQEEKAKAKETKKALSICKRLTVLQAQDQAREEAFNVGEIN